MSQEQQVVKELQKLVTEQSSDTRKMEQPAQSEEIESLENVIGEAIRKGFRLRKIWQEIQSACKPVGASEPSSDEGRDEIERKAKLMLVKAAVVARLERRQKPSSNFDPQPTEGVELPENRSRSEVTEGSLSFDQSDPLQLSIKAIEKIKVEEITNPVSSAGSRSDGRPLQADQVNELRNRLRGAINQQLWPKNSVMRRIANGIVTTVFNILSLGAYSAARKKRIGEYSSSLFSNERRRNRIDLLDQVAQVAGEMESFQQKNPENSRSYRFWGFHDCSSSFCSDGDVLRGKVSEDPVRGDLLAASSESTKSVAQGQGNRWNSRYRTFGFGSCCS